MNEEGEGERCEKQTAKDCKAEMKEKKKSAEKKGCSKNPGKAEVRAYGPN